MPKVSKIQASFNTGQISKSVYGRVDNPRYEAALAKAFNYIPIVQGPLIRRPGTKYVANWKNSTQAPALVPFSFSLTQNYIFEFGDKYIRFYANEGQIVTNTTSFYVAGHGVASRFTGIRSTTSPNINETISASSVIASGSILELPSPYAYLDVPKIKFTQKQDTLYLTHPSYPTSKLVRTGFNTWDLKTIEFQDGPYLPLNSYLSVGDAASVWLTPSYRIAGGAFIGSSSLTINTAPVFSITAAISNGSSAVTVTAPGHNFVSGAKVFIDNVMGATSLNNVTGVINFDNPFTNSSVSQAYWSIQNLVGSSTFDLAGATLNAPFVGSTGTIFPALFQLVSGSSGQYWNDVIIASSYNTVTQVEPGTRNIGFIINGMRYWGYINSVINAAMCTVQLGAGQQFVIGTSTIWQMGVYNYLNGFPAACCFHQDRLTLAGVPGIPQEFDGSMTSNYEVFSASGSNIQVNNNNALQFSLSSQDLNAIKWIKSSNQGLVAGTQSSEWAIAPSTQTPALTPTNINATQVSNYGSYDADALLAANSILYIQRAQRKVRELLYFWQVGSFRSTNLSELSETITLPMITKIVNQKEPHPLIWGVRTDGAILSMSYKRDDVTLQAEVGWAYHQLGGQSDQSGTPPIVQSLAVIPSGDTTYDELWLSVQRFINSSVVGTIEYMTKPFDDTVPQELAYHFDCGATYNSSIVVTAMTNASSCVVTAPNHGLTNSTVIRFYNITGMNLVTTDVNNYIVSSSVFNETTFVVTNATTNTFQPQDFYGNFINTNSTSVYVGSAVVNALVSNVSGFMWLKGETVSVLADGGICQNTVVNSAGLIALQYPAAVVSVGYQYNSDGQMLRSKDGSAQGSSIGSTRRVSRVAFMLHNVGDFSFGPNFSRLIPAEFANADVNLAGVATPIFDGIHRDGIESDYGFSDTICFRQNSGLPGMVQAITRFLEEEDV